MAFRNSSVKINRGVFRKLQRSQIQALEKTAEYVHTEIQQAQVMPRDTGALQNENTYVDYSASSAGTCSIVSSTPYARRLYFHPEYHFSKDENANAGGKWFEPWCDGGDKAADVKKTYAAFYRQEAGT